jgi:hypothetical protein
MPPRRSLEAPDLEPVGANASVRLTDAVVYTDAHAQRLAELDRDADARLILAGHPRVSLVDWTM